MVSVTEKSKEIELAATTGSMTEILWAEWKVAWRANQ